MIVHQHDADQPALLNTLQRLLKVRLGRTAAEVDPLVQMRQGMQALAERDADQQLASLLQKLIA